MHRHWNAALVGLIVLSVGSGCTDSQTEDTTPFHPEPYYSWFARHLNATETPTLTWEKISVANRSAAIDKVLREAATNSSRKAFLPVEKSEGTQDLEALKAEWRHQLETAPPDPMPIRKGGSQFRVSLLVTA